MSPASLFSLPLNPSQLPRSLRASLDEKSRKRKREKDDLEDGLKPEEETSDAGSSQDASHRDVSSAAALSPDEAFQYRVAGQPLDRDLPGRHFPHASADIDERPSETRAAEATVWKELAELSPPLYAPRSSLATGPSAEESQPGVGLRLRHLAVLTTILHRCLLEGNFVRAGRAWGMLLRSEIHGRPMDLRAQGRWGIGAEILMWRDAQLAEGREMRGASSSSSDEDHEKERPEHFKLQFSKEGFDKARQYYERLILQYPYRKTFPDAASPMDFYPAMFGLWIYSTQEEIRMGRERLSDLYQDSGSDDDQLYDDSASETNPTTRGKRQEMRQFEQLKDLRKHELQQAEEIAARLDELLLSPPYSDSHNLLSIRGMVALWVGDLSLVDFQEGVESDERILEEPSDKEAPDRLMDQRVRQAHTSDEHERSVRRKRDETERARAIFVRLRDEGASIWPGVAHLLLEEESDIREPT